MKIAVQTVPNNPPLQSMPDFVKPNLPGSINFNADEQAQKELEALNQDNETQNSEENEEQTQTMQPVLTEYPKDYTGLLIGVLLMAVVVLLAGWWWFARRIRNRKKLSS